MCNLDCKTGCKRPCSFVSLGVEKLPPNEGNSVLLPTIRSNIIKRRLSLEEVNRVIRRSGSSGTSSINVSVIPGMSDKLKTFQPDALNMQGFRRLRPADIM